MVGNVAERVALVTAGAAGIGRVIAERLLADGICVHVSDINRDALDEFCAANPGGSASVADLSRYEQVESLFGELQARHGRLDILVNNVGIAGPTARVEHIEPELWDQTIAVDLSSAFYCTRLAVPLLKRQGGSIINMSSTSGLHGSPLRSPYAAAKWALIGLTKTWSMEMGRDGIRVNAICPGCVSGPRIENVIQSDARQRGMCADQIRQVYQRQTSMRVFVDPQDVADMAAYLCSESGRHVSGQAIALDGHTETLSNWLDD